MASRPPGPIGEFGEPPLPKTVEARVAAEDSDVATAESSDADSDHKDLKFETSSWWSVRIEAKSSTRRDWHWSVRASAASCRSQGTPRLRFLSSMVRFRLVLI